MSEQWKNLNLINVIYTKVSIYKKIQKKLEKKSTHDNHVIKYLKSIFFYPISSINLRDFFCNNLLHTWLDYNFEYRWAHR